MINTDKIFSGVTTVMQKKDTNEGVVSGTLTSLKPDFPYFMYNGTNADGILKTDKPAKPFNMANIVLKKNVKVNGAYTTRYYKAFAINILNDVQSESKITTYNTMIFRGTTIEEIAKEMKSGDLTKSKAFVSIMIENNIDVTNDFVGQLEKGITFAQRYVRNSSDLSFVSAKYYTERLNRQNSTVVSEPATTELVEADLPL